MQGGWLRLMYCYPDGVTDRLIETMLKHDNICNYIDLPLQHFSDSVLKRMNRRQTCASAKKLVEKLHKLGFTVRTSLIVGFPGETQDDFELMADCLKELKFERLGVFRYSAEEGTPAAELPGQEPDELKQERYETLMGLQEGISLAVCQEQIGKRERGIVDGRDGETGIIIARSMAQAPQVDGVTYISNKKDLTPGSFHDVLIKDAYEYDLLGELI
jgi:ribosomal protein S12 methylthiotransferase